jgi:hypothetical protein
MNPKDRQRGIPRKINMGRTGRPQDRRPPILGGQGSIDTSWKDINWTPRKLALASAVLGIPFLLVVVLMFRSGNSFFGVILIGIAMFVGLMYLTLRYIDKNEF